MKDQDSRAAPLRTAYEAALSEERLLWRRVGAAAMPADERVQAYGRWRAAADRVRDLSLQLRELKDAAATGQPGGADG